MALFGGARGLRESLNFAQGARLSLPTGYLSTGSRAGSLMAGKLNKRVSSARSSSQRDAILCPLRGSLTCFKRASVLFGRGVSGTRQPDFELRASHASAVRRGEARQLGKCWDGRYQTNGI